MRRNLYNSILVIILLFILGGCKSDSLYKPPKFKQKKSVSFEMLTGDLGFNGVNDLYLYDEYIIVVAWDFNSSYLHVYDRATGKHIKSGMHKGRGPNEILLGALNSNFDSEKGEVVMFDFGKKAIVRCNIPRFVSGTPGAIYSMNLNTKYNSAEVLPLNNGKQLWIHNCSPVCMPMYESPRFELMDDMGNVVFELDKFPYNERSWFRYNLYQFLYCAVAPSNDKFAIVSNYGVVVETYELLNDSIKEISTRYYIEPTIGNEKKFTNYDTILGVNDVYATDSEIYSAYDGEHYGNVPPLQYYNNIAIFDWEGNARTLLKTNMRVLRVCYDSNTKELYAVVKDENGCYLAKINNVQ